MWIGFGCRTRNRRDIFFLFSRPSHGTHLDLSSLSSQSSKSVLNDERIVFSCQWKSSISKRQKSELHGRSQEVVNWLWVEHCNNYYKTWWRILFEKVEHHCVHEFYCELSFDYSHSFLLKNFFFAALFWSVKFSFDFNL